MKIIKFLFCSIVVLIALVFGMVLIPYACVPVRYNGVWEDPLNERDALQVIGFSKADGVLFDKGVLVHVGRDFVAYGKYQIGDSFDEKEFVGRYGLTEPWTNKGGSFLLSGVDIEIPWFVVDSGMRKMERSDFKGSSFLTVWIDDLNKTIFVERTKF